MPLPSRLALNVILLRSCLTLTAASLPYRDASLPVEQRIDDLLARMTLEEKVGQMCQFLPPSQFPARPQPNVQDDETVPSIYRGLTREQLMADVRAGKIGSFLNFYRDSVTEGNALQQAALESRLGIPLIFGADAIHGHAMTPGATVFPATIGLAATFNENLVRETARVTAAEMRATGHHWAFAPNVEVVRDQRWGRVNETFGEDPVLVSRMGVATVQGLQGNLDNPDTTVVACAKHLIGGSAPVGGMNHAPADFSERTLREVFLPPFEAAVRAGVQSVMVAHNEVNGIPCHADSHLLTDVLKGELRFAGTTVSDWLDVYRLASTQRLVPTRAEACVLAVDAGLDMNMHGPGFFEAVIAAAKAGRLPMARIDDAVRRILRMKFAAHLFEQPFAKTDLAPHQFAVPAHRELALQAARESIVLLKNEGHVLPLGKGMKKIFVSGPNAADASPLGDWSTFQNARQTVSMLAGLRQVFGPDVKFDHLESGRFDLITDESIQQAVDRARAAEAAVLFVGAKPWRGAGPGPVTEGENYDRFDLGLPGRQLELVQKVHATGVPTIVVLINGGAICEPWLAENIPALVEAFYPGQQGGIAVAEVLAGHYNPSGRLPYTIVRGAGGLPGFYYQRPGWFAAEARFADLGQEKSKQPLYWFGHGLSYTTFTYSNLTVPLVVPTTGDFTVSVDIRNSGDRAGDEVALLYISDLVSSVTVPHKLLKDFKRVHLAPGETKRVSFHLARETLSLLDARLRRTVEPGEFAFMVGDQHALAKLD